ncbi:hypothetical protein [Pedobacter aquatilis]|uniref:hypothetical protein n=1 Tax=Pedobacter aquatilis TaxID=351343 RepID=UPI0029316859|nr:hypothetical protein [Pedobacter aquatilis]
MKKDKQNIDTLKKLIQNHGIIRPSEGFSERLKNVVITRYCLSYSRTYRKQEWLGKAIIIILIASALAIFLELKPSLNTMAMIVPVLALAVGLLSLIMVFKRLYRL